MALSFEIQARLDELRQKSLAGTCTPEEYREALSIMREGRVQAAATSAASKARKSTAKAAVNVDDLFGKLDGIGL